MKHIYRKLFVGLLLITSAAEISAQKIVIGNYTFKDKAAYYGELEGGKPNGKGKTKFANGDQYEGEYVKGKRQGFGTYTFTDGEKYEGQWFQATSMGAVYIILPTTTNMTDCGIATIRKAKV